MAARFFFHGGHLAEVVLPGKPFLRPGQYHRTFLDSGQYRKYSMFSAMQTEWKAFSRYIIKLDFFIKCYITHYLYWGFHDCKSLQISDEQHFFFFHIFCSKPRL